MSILKPSAISSSAGVYIFRHNKTPIYVGKAANLKKRLAFYFRKNISQKTAWLLEEATSLEWMETSSEIEAFLKEAELIKKHRPKYNIVLRDDKNYFYVGMTKEKFPKVFITHQPYKNQKDKTRSKINYVGPFTSGASLKLVLKLLRRIFPYCTCRMFHKRPCLNSQIGRCFGYCCLSEDSSPNAVEYQKSIENVVGVLSGRSQKLIKTLKKEMNFAAQNQEFEKAAKLHNQIYGLENISSHRLFLSNRPEKNHGWQWPKIEKNLREILNSKKNISRVEGYDISNISGKEATGSMVVFIDGELSKKDYRKFRIKTVRGISDVDMLREMIRRRLRHLEWLFPDFMLIDGGLGQLNAAVKEIRTKNLELRIKMAALAKREEELYTGISKTPIKLSSLRAPTAFFLQRVRDESHRFARVYHHKLRGLNFLK